VPASKRLNDWSFPKNCCLDLRSKRQDKGTFMENTSVDGIVKQGQALADKAADKAANLRGQARTFGNQGIDAVSGALSQARDAASDASDSIVAYTQKNPVKALAIAAASGALLYAVTKALRPTRD
jgi:ElaB/YqjD/DUF883 family membrane-anchored ribosome-binding protein